MGKDVRKLIFCVLALLLVFFATLFLKNRLFQKQKPEILKGASIDISVDSPFLYSLLFQLTQGTNASVSLASSEEAMFSLYDKEKKPAFPGAIPDVILYGENFLHSLDLTDYKNGVLPVKAPVGYAERKDTFSARSYFFSPKNGNIILQNVSQKLKDILPVEENYQKIEEELKNVEKTARHFLDDIQNPAVFYIGDTASIGWVQSLSEKLKVISLIDSKTENNSDLEKMFLRAVQKFRPKTVLIDGDYDGQNGEKNDFLEKISSQNPEVRFVSLEDDNFYQNFTEIYQRILDKIRESVVKLY